MQDEFEEKTLLFQCIVIRQRAQHGYDIKHIANMDETPMFFDLPPSRTVHKAGEKTISTCVKTSSYEKENFTVVLACCADGTKLSQW